jgi:predicted metal-dependent hydrolase
VAKLNMRARRPNFDFSQTPVHWARNPEFAQFWNAASTPFPYLERFLNKAMAKAAAQIKGDDEESRKLRQDIRIFIKQESNHYTLHEQFNAIMKRDGYDISGLEAMIEAEYERLWATKSFAFCLAYCEGFETLGPPSAHMMLDRLDAMFEGADPEVVALWKWHLMEEFEHRTVCYDVFRAIHGGYSLRIYGLFYQIWHLGGMVKKVRDFLLEQDRARMSPEEVTASEQRLKAAGRAMGRQFLKNLLRALSPWYSPHGYEEPRNYRTFMTEIEPRVNRSRSIHRMGG